MGLCLGFLFGTGDVPLRMVDTLFVSLARTPVRVVSCLISNDNQIDYCSVMRAERCEGVQDTTHRALLCTASIRGLSQAVSFQVWFGFNYATAVMVASTRPRRCVHGHSRYFNFLPILLS